MTDTLSLELTASLSDDSLRDLNEEIKEFNKERRNNLSITATADKIKFANLSFDNENILDNNQARDFLEALTRLIDELSHESGIKISEESLQQLHNYKIRYKFKTNPGESYINQKCDPLPLDFAIADFLHDEEYLKAHGLNIEERIAEAKNKVEQKNDPEKDKIAEDTLNSVNNLFGDIDGNNPYQFIPQSTILPNNHENRKNARDEGRKKLDENYKDAVIKPMIDWGSETVIIWEDEKSRKDDNLIKNGVKSHTKLFAYTLRTRKDPPVLEFYVGKIGSRVSGKETAPGLKQLSALGYAYFTMPPASELTKPLFKAYLEGAIITGMVPRLKSSENDTEGMKLSYGDLNDLMKLWKEKSEGKDSDAKIKFSLRLAEQVENFCSRGGGPASLLPKAESLKMQATFEKFTQSYASSLSNYMAKQQWDKVDVIAAKAAMSRILEELQQGSLYNPATHKFEAYNPLGDNKDKLIETFKYYQSNPDLKNKIRLEIKAEEDNGEGKRFDHKRDRIKEVERRYEIAWKKAVGDVNSYDIKMPDITFPVGLENAHNITPNTYKLLPKGGTSR